ncbi:MAG: tRNA (adenosine(37)-N6)-threonylcarbamoyltransferase complex ATPase subunit type 1 TsaE [Ignavibacteriales bacterium]|nr:tRNA (adenosine(37)-N6)-threonylcarbamoyltransferase complex ATPase subunit type 1 TsaE [Ignavibacteriales bacterium]
MKKSSSEAETRTMARSFGEALRPGDVVALYGELGSGKTQFVKGICEAFRVSTHVASPTFVILHRYEGTTTDGNQLFLYHFDLYRVDSAEEIYDLGYEEFFFGGGICIVEWAERLSNLLPAERYDIRLDFGEREADRIIAIHRKNAVPVAPLLRGRSA